LRRQGGYLVQVRAQGKGFLQCTQAGMSFHYRFHAAIVPKTGKNGSNCRLTLRKCKEWQFDTRKDFDRLSFRHAYGLIFRNQPDSEMDRGLLDMADFVNAGPAHFNQTGKIWRRSCRWRSVFDREMKPVITDKGRRDAAQQALVYQIEREFRFAST
jgi:hypothetical protein